MQRHLIKVLILLIPLTLAADVFLRVPRLGTMLLENMGGSMIYQSPITINGRSGSLSTFVFNETSDIISLRMARKLKLPAPSSQSTIILDVSGGNLCRYFIMKAPNLENACLVTTIEQRAGVFKDTGNQLPPWPDNIPVLNATIGFSAVCDKTGTTFLSANSLCQSPQQAADEAAEALSQAGWTATQPSTPDFKMFTKERQQCIVFSTENPDSREITINILQREGSNQ